MVSIQRQKMKDLLLRARVVVRTLSMKNSRRRFADYGPLHMSPVDRAGSVTEMKLVSVRDFQPAFRGEKFEKVVTRPLRREI